jgi:hypothetical protein
MEQLERWWKLCLPRRPSLRHWRGADDQRAVLDRNGRELRTS